MCLRTVVVPSVLSMYDRSMQKATEQSSISQRRLVKKSCYMDNLMASLQSVGMAKEVQTQLTELGNKAGFHICKLISQKPEVIEGTTVTDRAAEVDLEKKEFPITKAAGVVWIVQEDKVCLFVCLFVFFFQPTARGIPIYEKRNVLEKTATI